MSEPHRRELQAHCYRMMGSVHDAEDMVQETFLRAWRRRETFEGRASFRAWLYRIATNVCLDALEKRPKRFVPLTRSESSTMNEPIPADVNEPIWLEPFPDEWLIQDDQNPERQVSTRENIALAFTAALHLLPPRQRAVLILRDVLEWQASEVADLLEVSVPAVKSALHRARITLASRYHPPGNALDEIGREQLERYIQAWESADIPALLNLLTEDATFSMPPIPSWYQGRDTIRRLIEVTIFRGDANGRWRLYPTRANGQPAFGLYRNNGDQYEGYGVQVLTIKDGLIADIITFRNPSLFRIFQLPATLPIEKEK
ncbi:MAG: sigma-70 family RNA polymerase sigma factor [Anaerolineae bacterium]|nr:sigma-70 family RNA polymerase sigma factor [Anaerolineae bacterium]